MTEPRRVEVDEPPARGGAAGFWRSWWQDPRSVREVGEEPDYRFSLANERTFLAWIRTALALLGGGIAVAQLVPNFSVAGGQRILGIPLVMMSIALAVGSYQHWLSNEKAMRLSRPLASSTLPRLVGVGIAVIGLLALVLVASGSGS